ncbi:MAG TPA: hypothetical protein VMH83_01475 [Candidatus Acidoferrum sp.]|nr:hypothetical protein [Candidatus Acidoferrum sp.]
MLILPRSCFLHVPKTGGTWVKRAIEAAGIECHPFTDGANQHPTLAQCPCPEKFKFAFVRHPLNLYRSYWQFKMTYGWDPLNALDQACRRDDFAAFVDAVLTTMPGIYSRSLRDFVGPPGQEIDFIGKYESLTDDLIRALQLAGEGFDAAAIRALPPANASDKQRFPAEFTPELTARVLAAEAEAVSRFGYQGS